MPIVGPTLRADRSGPVGAEIEGIAGDCAGFAHPVAIEHGDAEEAAEVSRDFHGKGCAAGTDEAQRNGLF